MQILDNVTCRGASAGGRAGRTKIRVDQYAIYGDRGVWIAKKLRLLWKGGDGWLIDGDGPAEARHRPAKALQQQGLSRHVVPQCSIVDLRRGDAGSRLRWRLR